MRTSDALAHLAAFGLSGRSEVAHVAITLDSPDDVLATAEAQRVLPWVAAAVDAGMVADVADEWRRRLRQRQIAAAQTTMAGHAAAASVVARLARAGVADVRVLKGCATASLDYERPLDRFSSDVDILVRPDDLPAVLARFPEVAVPEPRRDHWQRVYGKATTVNDESGVNIDIHTMLGQGYFGLAIPLDELMATESEPFEIGGVAMKALDGPSRLIHAANHVAHPAYTGLHSRRDVLQLVLVSQVDWREAIDRATRWNVDALFARGVVRAWASFTAEPHPLLQWAQRHSPTGRQRLALKVVGDRPRGHLLTAPLALPPHRWPGYVLPLVVPSRAYLAENRRSWSTRTKSILAEVRPW